MIRFLRKVGVRTGRARPQRVRISSRRAGATFELLEVRHLLTAAFDPAPTLNVSSVLNYAQDQAVITISVSNFVVTQQQELGPEDYTTGRYTGPYIGLHDGSSNELIVAYHTLDGTAHSPIDYGNTTGEVGFLSGNGNAPAPITITVPYVPLDGGTFTFEAWADNGGGTGGGFPNSPGQVTPQNNPNNRDLIVASTIVTIPSIQLDLNGAAAGGAYTTDYKDDNAPVNIADSTSTVSASAIPNLTLMTATITNFAPGDILTVDSSVNPNLSVSLAAAVLSISGPGTAADYQSVLRTIKYDNVNGLAGVQSNRSITISAYYGTTVLSKPVTSTIKISRTASIDDSEATRGINGDNSVQMEFVVTLSVASTKPISIGYQTVDGSAFSGLDYVANNDTITFPANTLTQTISIQILGDQADTPQPDKIFTVELSTITENITLKRAVATGTIVDNDVEADTDEDPNGDDGDNCGCGSESSDMTSQADSSLDASAATGSLSLIQPLASGPLADLVSAVYQSDDNPHPIISVNELIPHFGAGDSTYGAYLTFTFGNLPPSYQAYRTPEGLNEDSPVQFAQEVDATSLSTGTYLWSMVVTYLHGSGNTQLQDTETYSGQLSIINHHTSPYGNRWWLSGLDQLVPQDATATQPEGVTYVSGDGHAAFFEYDSTSHIFQTPNGYYTTLQRNGDGSFTLVDPQGNKREFSSSGQLESSSQPTGNTTRYLYNGDGTLSELEDSSDHSIVLGYAGGVLSTVKDTAANITSVTVDPSSDTLTSIIVPAPQPGGAPVVTTMTYNRSTSLIHEVTQVSGTTLQGGAPGRQGLDKQTIYGFDLTTKRLDYIEHVDDGSAYYITPANVSGLPSSFTVPFVTETNRTAYITDEMGDASSEVFNSHGLVISSTDFNQSTTSYTRDINGRILTKTTAPPSNDEGLAPLVTKYTYDSRGNTKEVQYPDGSTEHWDYDPYWNVPTKHIDQLNHETDYTIDPSTGQVLTVHEIGTGTNDRTTTYTYTPKLTSPSQLPGGLILTETDPLGILTTYSYYSNPAQPGKFGQVETINYAVGTADHASVSYDYDAAGNMTTSTDELGRITTYQYDAQNQLIHTTLPNPGFSQAAASTSTTYDGSGRVLTQTDALNNTTQYVYDARGNLWKTAETDPNGGTLQTTYTYDSRDNLKTVTDPMGRVTKYDYDPMGNLLDVIAPDPNGNPSVNGPETSYTYDSAGNRKTMTDPNGGLTTYYYDAMNRLMKEVDPDPVTGLDDTGSQVTTYTYDAAGNMTSVTNAQGQTTYQYDNEGQLVRKIMPNPLDGSGPVGGLDGTPASGTPYTAYKYDMDGNVMTTTDALANTTTYEYDYRNRLTWTIEPDPGTGLGGDDSSGNPKTENIYDAAGQLIQTIDQLGQVTTYQYDGLGRVHEEIMPNTGDGSGPIDSEGNRSPYADPTVGYPYTVYTYDAAGDELTQTDSLGNTTSYQYDSLGRLTKETQPIPTDDGTDADRPVTQYAYDKDSERIETFDPLGHVTTDQYDGDGRLRREIEPNPASGLGPSGGPTVAPDAGVAYTAYTYDANGNLLTQADALGDTTTYVYDYLNRQTSVTDPDLNVTRYTYYAWGQQKTITDPDLNTTTYTYDHDGRTHTDTNQLGDARSYTYDTDGNVKSEIDRDDRTTTYQYDHLNREIAEDWYATGATSPYYTIGYSYNDDGSMQDATAMTVGSATADASYDYEYDGDGHLIQTTTHLGGLTSGVKVGQFYDDNGNLVSLQGASINGVLDFFNSYSYDHLNRLTQIYQFGMAGLFGLSGNPVANKAVNIDYNGLGQIDEIDRYSDAFSTTVANSTYSYDKADRLTGLLDTNSSGAEIEKYGWTFDAANRIMAFTSDKHSNDGYTYTYDADGQLVNANAASLVGNGYDYDPNGNRTDTTAATFVGTKTTDYTTIANNEVTSDGIYQYSYDAEGNMTQRTVLDSSGNPTGETLVLTWDNRNRLASVTDYTSSAKTTENWEIHYTYDMFNNMVGRQVISHVSGVASSSQHFIYDNGQIVLSLADNGAVQDRYLWAPAVDLLLAQEDANNNVDWALDDDLNSVRDWIDNTGTVVQHKSYDAFGNVISSTGTLDAAFGWTGRFDDPLTKLQYNTNRWYDAGIGRWISQDPIGFNGDPSNLYRYVGNSPTNAADPSGLVPPVVSSILLDASNKAALSNNEGETLLGRLGGIEAEHEKYAYFDAFHFGEYFDSLRQAAAGISVVQNSWSILTGGAAAQYLFAFDILALSGSISSTPEGTFLHELTHVLDDKQDWFLDITYSHRGKVASRQAEGLGYAAEQIFNNIYGLQRFEDNLKNRRFQSNADMNEAWRSAWSLLGTYPNSEVFVNGLNLGPVTDEDIERFSSYTGITVSQEAVFSIYSDMVREYYPCYELERAPTKPALK